MKIFFNSKTQDPICVTKTSEKVFYKKSYIFIIIIAAIGTIIYSNTLKSPLVFDDLQNITKNPYIRLTHLNLEKIYDAGFKSFASHRPLANISFAVNYYLGKYDVKGYHIVNIFIHIMNGILVFFIARITFKQLSDIGILTISKSHNFTISFVSLFAALLFTAHPIQVQSVTYIVQRMNSMAVMFYFLSLILYIYGRLSLTIWKRWAQWVACFVSWILALGSKEIAATLPLVLLLYEWYFFQDLSKDWLKQNLKYFIILIVLIVPVGYMFLGPNPIDTLLRPYAQRDFTMEERILTQFRVLVFYVSLLIYPHISRLNLLHHVKISHSLFNPITTFFSLLVLVSLLILAACLARKQRLLSFCIFWFFIHLLIESSFIGLEIIYEHRLYLPMFGFALMTAYFLFYLVSVNRIYAFIVSAVIIVSLGTATYHRNKTWQDPITLWSDVVSKSPGEIRGYNNLGNAYDSKGLIDEAIAQYQTALNIEHDSYRPELNYYYGEIHYNLASAYQHKGFEEKALKHYLKALFLKPNNRDAYNNIGVIYFNKGSFDKAIESYKKALRLDPNYVIAFFNLGEAYGAKGIIDKSIGYYLIFLKHRPDDSEAHYNIGMAYRKKSLHDKAEEHLRLAESLKKNKG